uniref:Uncharacterized protein n=1 Tax=Arundo donax TaxID=35708 RepID=A0A0A9F0N8_ARUDO
MTPILQQYLDLSTDTYTSAPTLDHIGGKVTMRERSSTTIAVR